MPTIKANPNHLARSRPVAHPDAYALSVHTSTKKWQIDVRRVEGVRIQTDLRKQTPDEAKEEFLKAHSLAGQIAGNFLKGLSQKSFERKLRHLTRDDRLEVQDLMDQIEICYLGDGWFKTVYRVVFRKRSDPAHTASIVIKVPKRRDEGIQDELTRLKKLSEAEDGIVPRRGDQLETQTGAAYFEEFIQGPSLSRLMKTERLTSEISFLLIRTLLKIYRVLGCMPSDIGHGNFVIPPSDKGPRQAVMLELGSRFVKDPSMILELINFYYGTARQKQIGKTLEPKFIERIVTVWKSSATKSGQPLRDPLAFDCFSLVLEVMGQDEGRCFLKRGLELARQQNVSNVFRRKTHLKRRLFVRPSRENTVKRLLKSMLWDWERNIEFRDLIWGLEDFMAQSLDHQEPLAALSQDGANRLDKQVASREYAG